MMARGKARSKILAHSSALVEGNYRGPSWDFLYQHSTVKHPDWNIGDRVVLPDGRVFRYGKVAAAGTAVVAYNGCGTSLSPALGYTVAAAANAVGDSQVTITLAGRSIDDLRGGFILIYDAAGADVVQFRGITGNTASDGDDEVIVYLDASLAVEVTAADGTEVFENPYSALTLTDDHSATLGVPAVGAAVSEYVWIQTWGPIVVKPGEDLGSPAGNARELVFNSAFDVQYRASFQTAQHAGFYLDRGNAAMYGPLIMLQISV